MKKKILFKGCGTAICTPFDKDGVNLKEFEKLLENQIQITPFNENGIDFEKLKYLIEWHIKESTDAIIVCGTTGEAATMTTEEKISTIKTAVDISHGRIPIIAGTGGKCRTKINGSWSDYYSGTKTYSDIVDGTTVSVEALADSGYHFKEWTDSGAPSTTSRDIVMNDSKSIEARFEVNAPDKFQVTYEAIPNGSATMEGAGTYDDGDTCTIKVNVSPGYTLNKVLVDGVKITLNSNNQYSFVVEKNIKVTIECDLIPEPTHYTLTVKTEDEGVAQGGVGINKESNLGVETAEFEDGIVATIHATAAEGYSFGGWWKDGVKVSDDVTLSVTVDANKTYIAKFTQDPYLELDKTSLTFGANGGTQTVNVTSNVEWTVS